MTAALIFPDEQMCPTPTPSLNSASVDVVHILFFLAQDGLILFTSFAFAARCIGASFSFPSNGNFCKVEETRGAADRRRC